MTSAHWRKFLPGLRGQGMSRVRPFEWFGHRPVEVVNKSQGGVSNVDIDGNNALQIKGYRSRHLHVCYTTP